jgi:hypothetical protein
MANRANNVPRVADEEAAPPVLTGETIAVVHCRGVVEVQRHGDVRLAEESPVHTSAPAASTTASSSSARTPRAATPARCHARRHEPIRALTTAGHQSLLLPYYRTGPRRRRGRAARPGRLDPRSPRARRARRRHLGNERRDRRPRAAPTLTATESRAVVWTDDDIDECRFRMFALHEIAGAMVMHNHVDGGPTGARQQARAMAQYGNSVTPPAMAWLIAASPTPGIDVSRIVDLFCGAGGSSIGAELAGGRSCSASTTGARVETHATNFQHADHDCEDISSLTTGRSALPRHARPT